MKVMANKRLAISEAEKILDKYFIEDPKEIPFEAILGFENVFYQERKLSNCLGNMIRNGKRGIITISSDVNYQPQKRFIIAHELGHWLMHKDVPNFNCDDKMLHEWHKGSSKYEVEANTFASELLMPKLLFEKACKGKNFSEELISSLSEKFLTSLTATAFRFTDIGNESLMLVFSRDKFARWYKSSSDFEFAFYGKFPIPSDTITAAYYRGEIDNPTTETVKAKKWFTNDWNLEGDKYLNELIFPIKSINACLTFLWQHSTNFEAS